MSDGAAGSPAAGKGAAAGAGAQLTHSGAAAWIERWDAQQQVYMPDREERFTVLIDVVQECAGRPDPLVLDLGCGPGSLATRLLRRLPAATVVAIDADPLLLALGRALAGDGRPAPVPGADRDPAGALAADGTLRFADRDLRVPGWSRDLGLSRKADAAVSTTALHWLPPDALTAMYAEVATALRPGGVLLNGDHLIEDEATAPTLVRLGRAVNEQAERRLGPGGHRETWSAWWDAATADPAFAGLLAERERRALESEHHGSPSGRLAAHVQALRAAGFAEIGTLWQRGDNRLLCAIMPG
jgi:SAM-dependent methyltransferase